MVTIWKALSASSKEKPTQGDVNEVVVFVLRAVLQNIPEEYRPTGPIFDDDTVLLTLMQMATHQNVDKTAKAKLVSVTLSATLDTALSAAHLDLKDHGLHLIKPEIMSAVAPLVLDLEQLLIGATTQQERTTNVNKDDMVRHIARLVAEVLPLPEGITITDTEIEASVTLFQQALVVQRHTTTQEPDEEFDQEELDAAVSTLWSFVLRAATVGKVRITPDTITLAWHAATGQFKNSDAVKAAVAELMQVLRGPLLENQSLPEEGEGRDVALAQRELALDTIGNNVIPPLVLVALKQDVSSLELSLALSSTVKLGVTLGTGDAPPDGLDEQVAAVVSLFKAVADRAKGQQIESKKLIKPLSVVVAGAIVLAAEAVSSTGASAPLESVPAAAQQAALSLATTSPDKIQSLVFTVLESVRVLFGFAQQQINKKQQPMGGDQDQGSDTKVAVAAAVAGDVAVPVAQAQPEAPVFIKEDLSRAVANLLSVSAGLVEFGGQMVDIPEKELHAAVNLVQAAAGMLGGAGEDGDGVPVASGMQGPAPPVVSMTDEDIATLLSVAVSASAASMGKRSWAPFSEETVQKLRTAAQKTEDPRAVFEHQEVRILISSKSDSDGDDVVQIDVDHVVPLLATIWKLVVQGKPLESQEKEQVIDTAAQILKAAVQKIAEEGSSFSGEERRRKLSGVVSDVRFKPAITTLLQIAAGEEVEEERKRDMVVFVFSQAIGPGPSIKTEQVLSKIAPAALALLKIGIARGQDGDEEHKEQSKNEVVGAVTLLVGGFLPVPPPLKPIGEPEVAASIALLESAANRAIQRVRERASARNNRARASTSSPRTRPNIRTRSGTATFVELTRNTTTNQKIPDSTTSSTLLELSPSGAAVAAVNPKKKAMDSDKALATLVLYAMGIRDDAGNNIRNSVVLACKAFKLRRMGSSTMELEVEALRWALEEVRRCTT